MPAAKSKRPPISRSDPIAPLRDLPPGARHVVAQLGQTLDGRIATVSGESRYINGEGALDHLHRVRAHVDAVLVGVGTVLADDPQLTVRRVPGRSPARVVIDPRGRMPAGQACMVASDVRRIVVRTAPAAVAPGVEEWILPAGPDGAIPPAAIIAALAAAGLARVLVEGGARTVSSFVDAGCVDRLHVLVAPMIIGSGQPGLVLAPRPALAQALRPATRVHMLDGGDVLFDCDLRNGGGSGDGHDG